MVVGYKQRFGQNVGAKPERSTARGGHLDASGGRQERLREVWEDGMNQKLNGGGYFHSLRFGNNKKLKT